MRRRGGIVRLLAQQLRVGDVGQQDLADRRRLHGRLRCEYLIERVGSLVNAGPRPIRWPAVGRATARRGSSVTKTRARYDLPLPRVPCRAASGGCIVEIGERALSRMIGDQAQHVARLAGHIEGLHGEGDSRTGRGSTRRRGVASRALQASAARRSNPCRRRRRACASRPGRAPPAGSGGRIVGGHFGRSLESISWASASSARPRDAGDCASNAA